MRAAHLRDKLTKTRVTKTPALGALSSDKLAKIACRCGTLSSSGIACGACAAHPRDKLTKTRRCRSTGDAALQPLLGIVTPPPLQLLDKLTKSPEARGAANSKGVGGAGVGGASHIINIHNNNNINNINDTLIIDNEFRVEAREGGPEFYWCINCSRPFKSKHALTVHWSTASQHSPRSLSQHSSRSLSPSPSKAVSSSKAAADEHLSLNVSSGAARANSKAAAGGSPEVQACKGKWQLAYAQLLYYRQNYGHAHVTRRDDWKLGRYISP